MDKEKPIIRRPDVLKKLNAESLHLIERGLLGDLPDRLKPNYIPYPVRGNSDDLVVAKPSGFLSACLPVIPDSPVSENPPSSEEEIASPLRKTFSFRDKLSRISLFGREKDKHEKPKWKTIAENEQNEQSRHGHVPVSKRVSKTEHENKSGKRYWFFRNKEIIEKNKEHRPAYKRSKSFEFLPQAAEEAHSEEFVGKKLIKNDSFHVNDDVFIDNSWASKDSLEYISNVYYDNDDTVFLKSIKELPSISSNNNSSLSTVTSASSGLVVNVMKSESVQDLLDEFDKAVEMFSETYLSDCEPYTRKTDKELTVREKRRSCSFNNIPSPKILQVSKVSEVSDDFKKELSRALSVKRKSDIGVKSARRGSVTDWFVLEDPGVVAVATEANKYRRGKKKVVNRVRRMSSTKYM